MTFNLTNLVTNHMGLIHLVASVIALILGTISLVMTKGSSLHKKIGYSYAVAMIVLLVTAFMLYNLFGRWGIFHWAAVVSSATLLAGLVPIIIRLKNYLPLHLGFMYWSVMGLYGAFAAEILVRIPRVIFEHGIPNSTFYNMTGISVGTIMFVAALFFVRLSSKWKKQFSITHTSAKILNPKN